MTNKNGPEIKPINTGVIQYNTKQSKYDNAAKLPARSISLGPSGSGKPVLLKILILKVSISRIFIVPVYKRRLYMGSCEKYIEHEMKINTKEDP